MQERGGSRSRVALRSLLVRRRHEIGGDTGFRSPWQSGRRGRALGDEHVSSRSLRAPCVERNSGKSLAGLCGAHLAELSQAHPLLVVETRKRAAAVRHLLEPIPSTNWVSCGPIAAPSLANLSSGGPERKNLACAFICGYPERECRRSRVVFSAAGNRSKIRRAFRLVST
jgi:hypothetical protein